MEAGIEGKWGAPEYKATSTSGPSVSNVRTARRDHFRHEEGGGGERDEKGRIGTPTNRARNLRHRGH